MGLFNFFKKENQKIIVPEFGIFELITDNQENRIEGKYTSNSFGEIELSFPTQSKQVSKYQIDMFNKIETEWEILTKKFIEKPIILSILIPEYKSYSYDEIDAEIVAKFGNKLKSIIIKNNKIDEIIEI